MILKVSNITDITRDSSSIRYINTDIEGLRSAIIRVIPEGLDENLRAEIRRYYEETEPDGIITRVSSIKIQDPIEEYIDITTFIMPFGLAIYGNRDGYFTPLKNIKRFLNRDLLVEATNDLNASIEPIVENPELDTNARFYLLNRDNDKSSKVIALPTLEIRPFIDRKVIKETRDIQKIIFSFDLFYIVKIYNISDDELTRNQILHRYGYVPIKNLYRFWIDQVDSFRSKGKSYLDLFYEDKDLKKETFKSFTIKFKIG
ncbi:MAG: hypothetical protein ARM1_0822 [Candidatus Micrarchaeota archaeon]|nr:MAG: hypothetical protein ARM1_0822 [Candidatus Micrarchaeota archaeon]